MKVKWLKWPSAEDWFAADSYLALLGLGPVSEKQRVPVQQFMAKDILRASGLHLLKEGSEKVASKIKKVKDAKPLCPIIIVRGVRGAPLIVADGYHRVCALYYVNLDAEVHCVVVDL